ncbi:transporter [Ganoderma sinense ZZ0214-1]|uniref:Transporter n=1 Tax=Ganoderma sinense ZZ0214-1 TaxID=1077348 RepID=A0A2G8SG34_9APHY|nr:transporter [Ganoderma sinense ZZ0214-1]
MSNTQDKDKALVPVNVKLVLIGNSSVGKSSLLLRFSDQKWHEASATVGVDFMVHKMDFKGKKVTLSIWDTAGMERFRTVTPSYYRIAQGIILVYDVANRESFDALPKWFAELKTCAPSAAVKIIIGNKVDKEDSREVLTSEGQAFATGMNALFIEASAKTAVGVQEAFRDVVERIIDTPELWQSANARKSKSGPKSAGPESAGVQPKDVSGSINIQQGSGEAKPQGGGCGC